MTPPAALVTGAGLAIGRAAALARAAEGLKVGALARDRDVCAKPSSFMRTFRTSTRWRKRSDSSLRGLAEYAANARRQHEHRKAKEPRYASVARRPVTHREPAPRPGKDGEDVIVFSRLKDLGTSGRPPWSNVGRECRVGFNMYLDNEVMS